jgi:hypothetical protein
MHRLLRCPGILPCSRSWYVRAELDGPKISRPPIDQGRFCATQWMRPDSRVQPNAADPLRNEARILARGHALSGTATTPEQELAGPLVGGLFDNSRQLGGSGRSFKSDEASGFLLSNSIGRVPAGAQQSPSSISPSPSRHCRTRFARSSKVNGFVIRRMPGSRRPWCTMASRL